MHLPAPIAPRLAPRAPRGLAECLRPLPRAAVLALLLAVGAAPAAAAAQPAQAPQQPDAVQQADAMQQAGAAAITQISDRHTLSRWAYPTSEAPVRSAPAQGARAIGRLRFLTSDQQAEIYLALARATPRSGQAWLEIELPGRPNGRTGWVPREALGPLHAVSGYLRVDRSTLRATLFRDGRAIFSAPIGVGKPGTITPAGQFYVMEKLITLDDPEYGPYAIGTSAYAPTLSEWPGGGVVGIHGTDEPQLIPGRPSHGCVRMRNEDVARLWQLIAIGTPIEII